MSRKYAPRAGLALVVALWGLCPAFGQAGKSTSPPADRNAGGQRGGGNEAGGQAGRQGPGGAFAMFNNPADQIRRLRSEVSTRPRGNNGGPGGGGPGMMMGGFGGGGGIIGLLLRSQPLQEELKLTEAQRASLTEINQNARDKMRDMTRQMFGQGGGRGGVNQRNQGGQGGQGGQRGAQRFQFDPQRFQEMQDEFAQLREENETAVGKVLTPAQKKRLNEIRLRILGPFAVAEEDVAQAIPLSEEQYATILDVMSAYDQESMAVIQEQFQGMRDRFGAGRGGRNGQGGAGGAPGQGQAPGARRNQGNQNQQNADDGEEAPAPRAGRRQPAAGGDENNGDAPAPRAGRRQPAAGGDENNGDAPAGRANRQRPAQNNGDEEENDNGPGGQGQGPGGRGGFQFTPEQQEEMQKRLTDMREKQDAVDKRAEAEIRKVLTPANRTKFNKMLGADFDLNKLAQAPDFGGPNGRRGGRNQDGQPPQRGTNNAQQRGQNNRPAADEAPAEGSDDESKSATERPRSRPSPRVRGSNS